MSPQLDYIVRYAENREIFLLNYGDDFRAFDTISERMTESWERLGKERDAGGASHAGLLAFANILSRHAILGFQHVASYQSYVGWFVFRPGLEALLLIGKFVDDVANATVWRNRNKEWRKYQDTFSGKKLISKSLPRAQKFQEVLTRLNDNYMHPNPDFTYRDMTIQDEGSTLLVKIEFFDKRAEIHEAHVLAFLNLFDLIRQSSNSLISSILGPPAREPQPCPVYVKVNKERARSLAGRNALARKILEELGLWEDLD